jgi:hypothetical protein
MPGTTHLQLLLLVGCILVFGLGVFKRTPGWGIATAAALLFPVSHFWLTTSADWPLVGQLAVLVWWIHSLRWNPADRQSRQLQTTGFVVWCLQSVLWFLQTGGGGPLVLVAGTIAVSAGMMIWLNGGVRYVVFCTLALTIAGLNGAVEIVRFLRMIPGGLLVMLGGLALFGMGTLSAQWRRNLVTRRQEVQQSFDGNNI